MTLASDKSIFDLDVAHADPASAAATRPVGSFLQLPLRTQKPRSRGLTIAIDHGVATRAFHDVVTSHADLIDMVKFGWGTCLVTKDIRTKVDTLQCAGINYFFGGTLFEKAIWQGQLDGYIALCRSFGCSAVEVSDGTIAMSRADKVVHIRCLTQSFMVMSEVGHKGEERSLAMDGHQWLEAIEEELAAGASYIILEARESGTSGICHSNGELRSELLEEIITSGLPTDRLVFEAPTKALQAYLVQRLGANVNCANVPLDGIVGLETLRVGLRFDTFMHFEGKLHA
jgi:phosphosulfolactate synthase